MGEEAPEGVLSPPVREKTVPISADKKQAAPVPADKKQAAPVPADKKPTEEKGNIKENMKDAAAEVTKTGKGDQQDEKEKAAAALEVTAKVKEEPKEDSSDKKAEAKSTTAPSATPRGTKEAKSSIPTPPVSNRPRRQVRKQDSENSSSK